MAEPTRTDQPDAPPQAAVPGKRGATRVYEREELKVLWDATLCTHAAACIRAQPKVFDSSRRPWIDVHAAGADAVADAIRQCPTGALRYEAKGDFPPEPRAVPTVVDVPPSGPLRLRGDLTITQPRGHVIFDGPRASLCRCGKSRNAPFCDNSHTLP
ncbi:MAG TPA: (4Fe-4S)-binding protein [Acidimicrobiales bacterium]|nr:(4Fe-4S)-binding protein [Acidimicrobiales bacterium]